MFKNPGRDNVNFHGINFFYDRPSLSKALIFELSSCHLLKVHRPITQFEHDKSLTEVVILGFVCQQLYFFASGSFLLTIGKIYFLMVQECFDEAIIMLYF